MPIPVIIWGIGIAVTALYGGKKAVDGYSDSCEAENIQSQAEEIIDEANESLERTKQDTMSTLEGLGRTKLDIWGNEMNDFVKYFSQIKNVTFVGSVSKENVKLLSAEEMIEIKNISFNASELVSGGAVSLGAGALAGFGAFGGAAALGTASTGTAIGALSGIAAQNATLAWFGGGALSAGGAGMAGGVMVLGGLVTAPILAIGGWFYSQKSKEKLAAARSNRAEARKLKAEMEKIETALSGITKIVELYEKFLKELSKELEKINTKISSLIKSCGEDYRDFSKEDKDFLYFGVQIVSLLKGLLAQTILKEDGQLVQGVSDILLKARKEHLRLERSFE